MGMMGMTQRLTVLEFFSGTATATEVLTVKARAIAVKNTHASATITLTVNIIGARTLGPFTLKANEEFSEVFEPFNGFTITTTTSAWEAYTLG